MAEVIKGRFTARMDEPFVVFIIGMRINRPLAVRKWLPTFRAMGPMLRELYKHPEKGFLGGEFFFYGRGPALLQYWRSFEDLEKFARNPDDPHMPAWQRFNRTVGTRRERRDLPRDLHRRAWQLRGDLLQHARVRARQGHRARQGNRRQGDRATTPHARRERTSRALPIE